jgi:hypothetical protein
MTSPFMDAYVQLLIKTCHRRGVHAMGGMAAQIPIKNDTAANDAALAKVCGNQSGTDLPLNLCEVVLLLLPLVWALLHLAT